LPPRPSFAEVYETYFKFVWRSARRLGTPEPNLDDVVQEIFMVAFRRQDEFEGRSSVKTWLYGIVFNVVRSHRRELAQKHPQALAGERRAETDLLVDDADGPHERASKNEAAQVVDRFLDGLDDDRRAVFVLAELEQLTAPEIATVVNAPLNTVYSRLRLARLDFAKAVARHRAREDRGNP
jgi:RNA polymerase sigma-70 factor (ECF subfamily)